MISIQFSFHPLHSFPLPVLHILWWHFSKTLIWGRLYQVFTYIYSLLIEKDICDRKAFQLSFCGFLFTFCLEDSSFFWQKFLLSFPIFFVISANVFFLKYSPYGLNNIGDMQRSCLTPLPFP
jgi:hypothetical protein